MRAVTTTFLDTVRGSHKAVFRARVVQPLQTSTNPVGTEVPIISGDVTFNTNSDVNASCDLSVSIDWPETASSLGAPYGQELFIERGVQYGNGVKEWVGLGYFRINSTEQDGSSRDLVRFMGEDRMSRVRDARPLQPVPYTSGTSVGAVIDAVVAEAIPGVTTVYPDWDPYSVTLGSDHILDDDRIKFLKEIVTAYGRTMYFDYKGRFVVKKIPDPVAANAVWDVSVGKYGVLCSFGRVINRDGVYNAVVATGEPIADQPPVRGVALDLNTTSPTYYLGPFGPVPRFFSSSFLTTNDQAASAALSILQSATGLPYVVSLGVVPNPALEGWDILKVTYDPRKSSEYHVVDTITYRLEAQGLMNIATRKQFLT